jgi:hypothetical protein
MAKLLTGTRIYGTGTVDTQLFVNGTNSATSTTTGALQVVGGVGIGGNLHVGGIIYGAILGTATTATNADNVKTVSQTTNASYYPAFVDSNNSTAAYEALYTTSSFVINPQSGNVGIGESDPLRKFVVRSDSSGAITAIGIYNGNTATSNGSVISFRSDTTGTGAATFQEFAGFSTTYTDKNHATRSADFNIFTANSGTVATRVIVKSTGNVGIGTSTPLSKFVVSGGTVDSTTYTSSEARIADGTLHLMKTSAGGVFEALRAINNDTTVGTTVRLLAAATSDPFNNGNGGKVFIDAVRTASNMDLIFSLNDTGGAAAVERLRILGSGAIAFNGSTNYGITGQILQSNGNAAPTWISTGSLFAANATTATHLSGGVAGQIPYQTAPGVTAFLSTGTAGDVLVSNGSSAATYNNTLRLAGSTNATSTTSGALQVVGGVGVGGDLFIHGDIRTNDTLFNLINGNAITVNFAGDATTLTMGASGSGTTNVRNNLTVSGNLTVQGTTTIVDSTVTNIADPIITLGGGTGNSAPTADDNKDRGVAFKWVNNGGTTSTGFFGYDDSTGYFTYVQTATITNEVVSGTKGAMDVNLAGGTAMSIVYQSSPNNTAFLAASTSGYLLQTNGTGVAPSWVSATGVSAGSATYADQIRTLAQTASASYYPTFVDSNNASNTYELVYTTSSFSINPATGVVTIAAPAGGDGVPSLRLTQGSAPSTFNWVTSFINSSLTAGKNAINLIGQAESGNNSAYFGFKYVGASSATNFATIGLYGADNLLNILANGNVGIGTTSPAQKLDVNGVGNFASGVQVGASAGLSFGASKWMIQSETSSLIRSYACGPDTSTYSSWEHYTARSNGTPVSVMRWDANGNVGIGTSSPAAKLDVVKTTAGPHNVRIYNSSADASSYAQLQLQSDAGSLYIFKQSAASVGIGGAGSANLYADGAYSMIFHTNATERLRITAAGGIAFGGAANYGTSGFVLKSNGDAAPTWVDPSTLASASSTNADNIRTVAQAASATYYPTFVDSNNASNAYELVYTTGTIVLNPSYGSVGIGANPSINSYGSATTSIKLNLQHTPPQNTTIDDVLRLSSKFVAASNTASAAIGSGPAIVFAGGIGDNQSRDRARIVAVYEGSNLSGLAFHTQTTADALAEAMRISNNGRVGIGTQSPGQVLEVNGRGLFTGATTASAGSIQVTSTDAAIRLKWTSSPVADKNTWDIRSVGTGTTPFLQFRTINDANTVFTDRVVFTNDGNVGVGTTAPRGKFESVTGANGVNTNADVPGTAGAFVGPTGAGQGSQLSIESNDAIAADTGGVLAFGGRYSGTALATWAAIKGLKEDAIGGNYGGYLSFYTRTNGAGYPERMRITPTGGISFGASGTAYGSSGQVLQSNGNAAPTWINQSSVTSGATSLTNTYVGYGSASNLLTGSSNFTWDGTKLLVSGTSISPYIKVSGTGGLYSYIQLDDSSSNGYLIKNVSSGTGNGALAGALYTYTDNSKAFQHIHAGTPLFTILSTGNVGIGTTAPATKLSVGSASHTSPGDTNRILNWYGTSGGSELHNSVHSITAGNDSANTTQPQQVGLSLFNYNATDNIWSPAITFGGRSTSGNYMNGAAAIAAKLPTNANDNNFRGGDIHFFTQGTTNAGRGLTSKMVLSANGNVSIGTTSTTNKFEVAGTAGQLFSVSDSFTGTIFSVNDVSGIPSIEVIDTGLIKMAQYNGVVAIGTGTVSSSTAELSVYGMLYTMGTLGEIRASSEITAYFSSDARLKENIKLIENPITIIDQIRGVTFDWTDEHMARRGGEDGYFVRKHDIGVIAQEVQAVLPELVGTREDGYLAVKYEKMVPLLIEAIKAQQKTIDSLVNDLDNIKEFINQIKNGI